MQFHKKLVIVNRLQYVPFYVYIVKIFTFMYSSSII
jgi:hypothetical protein